MIKHMFLWLRKHPRLVAFMFLWLLFSILGNIWLDPDYGWHYKMGELIVSTGFPQTDPFTYTMPSFRYIDYEWLNNVLFYLGTETLGYTGLAILYAFVATSAIFAFQLKNKKHYWFFPSLITASIFISFFGIRPQVLSWFLFSLVVWLVYSKAIWQKYRWLYPLVMAIWTNVHGSYPLGLLLGGTSIVFSDRRKDVKNIIWFAVGFAITLVNPYGLDNFREVVKQMSLSGLFSKTIMEWLPFYTYPHFGFIFIQVFNIIFVWRRKVPVPRWYMLFYIFLLGSALHSVRLVIYSVLFSVPLTQDILLHFEKSLTRLQQQRLGLFYKLLLVVAALIVVVEVFIGVHSRSGVTETAFYPKEAVEFLSENPYSGNLFSTFNWGGYLIWKYPQKKLYADGRVAGFFWDAPEGESDFVFKDYLDLECGTRDFKADLDHYFVTTVLLPHAVPVKVRQFDKILKPLFENMVYCFTHISFESKLKEYGWVKVYEDHKSVIYQRPQ